MIHQTSWKTGANDSDHLSLQGQICLAMKMNGATTVNTAHSLTPSSLALTRDNTERMGFHIPMICVKDQK